VLTIEDCVYIQVTTS